MLKFKTLPDLQLFLLEVNRVDLVAQAKEESITDEMFEQFIRGRRSLVPQLKDFRRQQNSKEMWRKNRYKIMKGIHGFHKSTAGKRMHRALSRYAVSHCTDNEGPAVEKSEGIFESFNHDTFEFLKALSSLKTHYWIERSYYHSVDEEIDLQILGEELLPAVDRVEKNLLQHTIINEDDFDLLIAVIHPTDLQLEVAEQTSKSIEQVRQVFTGVYKTINMVESGSNIKLVNKVLSELSKY